MAQPGSGVDCRVRAESDEFVLVHISVLREDSGLGLGIRGVELIVLVVHNGHIHHHKNAEKRERGLTGPAAVLASVVGRDVLVDFPVGLAAPHLENGAVLAGCGARRFSVCGC